MIKRITQNSEHNIALYKDMFADMSDKEFDVFMQRLRDKKVMLQVVAPNDGSVKLSVKNNMEIMESIGGTYFHQVIFGATGNKNDPNYTPAYKTPQKFLVYDLPWRRTSQLLTKGISVPKDNHTIDLLTGQVTGESKSAKLSKPELEVLLGLGLEKTVKELMKIRGGDLGAARALEASIGRTGGASQDIIDRFSTGVESTKTVKAYLTSAHLKTTL